MNGWRIFHKAETASTNLDARAGAHGDVFTADHQTEGRGRLDHKWVSPAGANLLMSVVLSVGGREPQQVATLPLAVGLAVAKAVSRLSGRRTMLKWPNDVMIGNRKVSGILCELNGETVIAGIGVNVREQEFPAGIAERACALGDFEVDRVRDEVLDELAEVHRRWLTGGFGSLYAEIAAMDWLRDRRICVWQTDDDREPLEGVSGGIRADGSLDVGGKPAYAGEAHVTEESR